MGTAGGPGVSFQDLLAQVSGFDPYSMAPALKAKKERDSLEGILPKEEKGDTNAQMEQLLALLKSEERGAKNG